MGAQIPLLNIGEFQIAGVTKQKKRIRYKTPTYTKSYSFCHINPFTDELQYNGDERHIFRIRNLQHIYSRIYGYLGVNLFERAEKITMHGLTIWPEDMQAEFEGSEMLSIKDRIKIHIKLLRLLKQGYNVKDAVEKMKGENSEKAD